MIHGVGVDLVSIKRVEKLISKNKSKFLSRCFTEHEIEYSYRYSDPSSRLAARFAAKEAVMKSLGFGWRDNNWKDIEIKGGGKPSVNFLNKALAKLGKNKFQVYLSISHEEGSAVAFAIAEKK